MKKVINLKLSKNNKLIKNYNNINALYKDDEYIFYIEKIKTIMSSNRFLRENEEYKFTLDIKERKSTYCLKNKNASFDIEVEELKYKEYPNEIVLEYKISTDEEKFKIEMEMI